MFLRAVHRPCSRSKPHWRPLALNSSARQRIGRESALPRRHFKTDDESPNHGVEFNGRGTTVQPISPGVRLRKRERSKNPNSPNVKVGLPTSGQLRRKMAWTKPFALFDGEAARALALRHLFTKRSQFAIDSPYAATFSQQIVIR